MSEKELTCHSKNLQENWTLNKVSRLGYICLFVNKRVLSPWKPTAIDTAGNKEETQRPLGSRKLCDKGQGKGGKFILWCIFYYLRQCNCKGERRM